MKEPEAVNGLLIVSFEKSDRDMNIYSANQSFYQSYKIKPYETIGKNFFKINNRQWDVPTFRELLEKILPENAQVNDYLIDENFPMIGHKKIAVNACQIYQERIKMILVAIEEVKNNKK